MVFSPLTFFVNAERGSRLASIERLTKLFKTACVCLIALALSACAQTQVRQKAAHFEPQQSVSVLLMPVDIELSALTAGGLKEVRADWTATAKEHVTEAVGRQLARHGDQLLAYTEPLDNAERHQHIQIIKLHGVVGKTIMLHSLIPASVPPTRQHSFDWSLGTAVSSLRKTSGADYGLFVYLRDSYATAGRKTLIVASAMFGIAVPGGSQIGFATLVDLRDGSVVWFNRIHKQTGDLRTKGAVDAAVQELIDDIPL
jgi:hypothetical protein